MTVIKGGARHKIVEIPGTLVTAAITQGSLCVLGGWCGIARNAAAIGAPVTLECDEMEVDVTSSVDGVADTFGEAVYYNPTTGVYAAASASGNALVGYTTIVKDTNNVFRMELVRRATVAA